LKPPRIQPVPRFPYRAAIMTACLWSSTIAAHAHDGTGLAGGFVAGFAHPWSGCDHLLAMAAVGIWGAFLGRPLVGLLPLIFPLMMVAGAVFGMCNLWLPPVETGIAVSLLVLGGCIAGALRLPVGAACSIVAVFAVFHGYAHGQELPSAADPVGYSMGFVLATGLIHLCGIALGRLKDGGAGLLVLLRACGGGIAMMGAWLLFRAAP
jgi:urease accessory protein